MVMAQDETWLITGLGITHFVKQLTDTLLCHSEISDNDKNLDISRYNQILTCSGLKFEELIFKKIILLDQNLWALKPVKEIKLL